MRISYRAYCKNPDQYRYIIIGITDNNTALILPVIASWFGIVKKRHGITMVYHTGHCLLSSVSADTLFTVSVTTEPFFIAYILLTLLSLSVSF